VISDDRNKRLKKSLSRLRKLVDAREELSENLRNLEKDIDIQIREIVQHGREILSDDTEIDLVIALAHCNLTGDELSELTGQPVQNLVAGLAELREKQIVEQQGAIFRLCGINAE
jgi:ArsR family transcriptional regulator